MSVFPREGHRSVEKEPKAGAHQLPSAISEKVMEPQERLGCQEDNNVGPKDTGPDQNKPKELCRN